MSETGRVIYNEASHPGSSQPNRTNMRPAHGSVIPRVDPRRIRLPGQLGGEATRHAFTAGSFHKSPPASMPSPQRPVVMAAMALPLGVTPRPPSPPALGRRAGPAVESAARARENFANRTASVSARVVAALPAGARDRAVALGRATARFRQARITSHGIDLE